MGLSGLSGLGGLSGVLPPPSGGSLLLDQYSGAFAAYSLKKLRDAYTGSAIRVRRSSDNTEQDIGFNGSNLNTAALATFVGANSGFVTTIYDQSGNGRNLIQATTTDQPRIVNAGTIDLLSNGSPGILFNQNPWMRWIGAISVETSCYLSYQINSYISSVGILALIPPVGQNDFSSTRGAITVTRVSPNVLRTVFASGIADSAAQDITAGADLNRSQVGIFRHAGVQSFYNQGSYGADDSYSASAGMAEGIGVGARWWPTGSGFAPSAGSRGNFRLETLIVYTTNQRNNAAAITALM